MGQQRRRVLFEAVGQKEWPTARSQHLDDLMHYALGHGQRALADIDGQEQLGHRVDGPPDPVRGAGQASNGLGLADLPVLDRPE
jgi:hypothetical protein